MLIDINYIKTANLRLAELNAQNAEHLKIVDGDKLLRVRPDKLEVVREAGIPNAELLICFPQWLEEVPNE